jgi:hypothetical protein
MEDELVKLLNANGKDHEKLQILLEEYMDESDEEENECVSDQESDSEGVEGDDEVENLPIIRPDAADAITEVMRSEADAADNSFNVESDPDWVKCKSFR